MKKSRDSVEKIKRWMSFTYKKVIEIIGVILIIILFLISLFITVFNLCLILSIVNDFNDGILTINNFTKYYIGCISTAFIAILYHKLSRKIIFTYPVEYKKHCGINRNANVYHSMFFGAGIFSDRLFIYVFYFCLLYLEQKIWMLDAAETADLMFFVKANQISVILLGAIDLVVGEVRKTRELFGYGLKAWLELLYLERLDIMRKSTKRRMHCLLTKEKYKDLFNEFGYVIDEIGWFSSAEFVEYAKKNDLKNKEQYFYYCYETAMKSAIIIRNNDDDINLKIIEYLKCYFKKNLVMIYDDIIKHNIFFYNSSCFCMATEMQIENCNKLISKYGYELRYEFLQNEEVFIKVQSKSIQKQGRVKSFFESLKRTYKEITKE